MDDPALWISISELARRKGISQQAVSERIGRLGSKIELRPGRGRERLVNIAQFDQLTATTVSCRRRRRPLLCGC
jgi:hypothetical protein